MGNSMTKQKTLDELDLIIHYAERMKTRLTNDELMAASITSASLKASVGAVVRSCGSLLLLEQKRKYQR